MSRLHHPNGLIFSIVRNIRTGVEQLTAYAVAAVVAINLAFTGLRHLGFGRIVVSEIEVPNMSAVTV